MIRAIYWSYWLALHEVSPLSRIRFEWIFTAEHHELTTIVYTSLNELKSAFYPPYDLSVNSYLIESVAQTKYIVLIISSAFEVAVKPNGAPSS